MSEWVTTKSAWKQTSRSRVYISNPRTCQPKTTDCVTDVSCQVNRDRFQHLPLKNGWFKQERKHFGTFGSLFSITVWYAKQEKAGCSKLDTGRPTPDSCYRTMRYRGGTLMKITELNWFRLNCYIALYCVFLFSLPFVSLYVLIYIYIYIYICMYVCVYVCTYVYVCMYVCLCTCVCLYVCVYVCIYVYAYMYLLLYVPECW